MIVIVLWPASSAPVMMCYLQGTEWVSEATDLVISEILQYSIFATGICRLSWWSGVPSCYSQMVSNLGHIHVVVSLGSYA